MVGIVIIVSASAARSANEKLSADVHAEALKDESSGLSTLLDLVCDVVVKLDEDPPRPGSGAAQGEIFRQSMPWGSSMAGLKLDPPEFRPNAFAQGFRSWTSFRFAGGEFGHGPATTTSPHMFTRLRFLRRSPQRGALHKHGNARATSPKRALASLVSSRHADATDSRPNPCDEMPFRQDFGPTRPLSYSFPERPMLEFAQFWDAEG